MKLNNLKRYVVRNGKKPIGKWKSSNDWLNYEDALRESKKHPNGGVSLVVGKLDDNYTIAVIDADTIRNKDTGEVDIIINDFITPFNHKHISLSGYGIHCICLVRNDFVLDKGNKKSIKSDLDVERYDENNKLKIPEIEFYIENKVIALPIDINIEDEILEQTDNYKKIYDKFFIKAGTDKWYAALLNGERLTGFDESKNDYALIGELKKRGYTKEDAIKKFMNSNHYNTKDDKHREKCRRNDYLSDIYDGIEEEINNDKGVSQKKKEAILDIFKECPKFLDKMGIPTIYMNYNNYQISDKDLFNEIEAVCYSKGLNVGKETINSALSILSADIKKNGRIIDLDMRVAKNNDDILYQLNKKEMVVINKSGYSVELIDKPIFKVYSNLFREQVKPSTTPSINDYLTLLNVHDDDKKLISIYLISLFVPNISIPIMVFNAERGSGKSTITTLIKEIVDPTVTKGGALDKSIDDIMRKLDHSYLVCFDNIDSITNEQSNMLCRACTGEAIERRALYTDNDVFVFKYKRPIIINGINCPTNREDFLSRSILIDLKSITLGERRTEEDIFALLNKVKPDVLAYVFSTLSKAISIKENTKLKEINRLADWYVWAYCIAEAMEKGGGKEFERIYKYTTEKQNKTIVINTDLAQCLLEYTKSYKLNDPIEIRVSDLYNDLMLISSKNGWHNLPKNSSNLTKGLNRLISVLKSEGLEIKTGINKTNGNYISIKKVG